MPDMHVPSCLTALDLARLQSDRRKTSEADDACRRALAEAEVLAQLLDRHNGDAGQDADPWLELADLIEQIGVRVRAAFGEPAEAIVLGGQVIGLVRR